MKFSYNTAWKNKKGQFAIILKASARQTKGIRSVQRSSFMVWVSLQSWQFSETMHLLWGTCSLHVGFWRYIWFICLFFFRITRFFQSIYEMTFTMAGRTDACKNWEKKINLNFSKVALQVENLFKPSSQKFTKITLQKISLNILWSALQKNIFKNILEIS